MSEPSIHLAHEEVAEPEPASPRTGWRLLTHGYHRLLSHLLVVSVVVLVIPVSLQIFSRFTALLPHYIWTEEMARFLFIWMIMLGAMIGVREWSHFEVDVLPRMGPKPTAAVDMLACLAILGFAMVFAWSGVEFTRFALNRSSELADLPLWMIHVAWPLTGFTWIVFLGERMSDDLSTLRGRRA